MARHSSVRRGRIRRLAALGTLVFVGVGMLALEHTATGASTGRPSHVTTTTARHNDPHHDKHDDGRGDDKHGNHDPSTTRHETTTTQHVTTTTQHVTTTTMRHCERDHGRHHDHDHCRPPSGGHDDHHDPHKNDHQQNNHH